MHVNCFQYVKVMIWWDLRVSSSDWEHVDWPMFYVIYEKLRNACIEESLGKTWDEMICISVIAWAQSIDSIGALV
jgi:hypothetical protein